MESNNPDVSESEKFLADYEILLQKVKQRFKVKDHKWISISKPKASRILSGKQFDILILCNMAYYVGYDVVLFFKERNN